MTSFHTYIIASLPLLSFNSKPPLSLGEFFARCEDLLAGEELGLLKKIVRAEGHITEGSGYKTLERWSEFETDLRNELVRSRAAKKKVDPARYLRGEGLPEPNITHLAMNAYRHPSPLEAERLLDEERWRFLDEICLGHYFDFDFLIGYVLKLLILERWHKVTAGSLEVVLEDTIKG